MWIIATMSSATDCLAPASGDGRITASPQDCGDGGLELVVADLGRVGTGAWCRLVGGDGVGVDGGATANRLTVDAADEWHRAAWPFVPKAVAALEAVLAAHRPHACPLPGDTLLPREAGCFIIHGGECASLFRCQRCGQSYPCLDVEDIEEALR